ncbi:lipopolysaccharide biosynthesis protein [Caulobacter segnis]|nr:lipopolysaccharide biosynthesis protein [Caulobacter segnis]
MVVRGDEAQPAEGQLGARATKSVFWIGGAQIFKAFSMLVSSLIIARVLSPGDFGVVAMAAPVTAFIILFQDLGLSQAVIQANSVRMVVLNSLFWINILTSTAIMVILIIASPFVGLFYSDVRVGWIVAASALNVLISGTALQHSALLARELRFRQLAFVDLSSAAANFLVSVSVALTLKTYWAIWGGTLAGVLVQAALLWRFEKWRPAGVAFSGARDFVKFGGGVTGFNLLNFLVRNLDNVLVARFSGATAVGLYDQSYKLMMAPMQTINAPLARVVMPVLSRLQGDQARYRRAFLTATRAMLLILTPGLAVAVALSDRLIPFLLGDRWAAASPIFFWLSLTGLIQPLANATGWLFLSSGRTNAMFHWGVFSAVVTLAGFAVGIQWGAVGVAAALFWTALVRMPLLFAWCVKGTGVRALDLYAVQVEPMACALVTILLSRIVSSWGPMYITLLICVPLSYALGLSAYCVSRGGRHFLKSMISTGRQMVSGRKKISVV